MDNYNKNKVKLKKLKHLDDEISMIDNIIRKKYSCTNSKLIDLVNPFLTT